MGAFFCIRWKSILLAVRNNRKINLDVCINLIYYNIYQVDTWEDKMKRQKIRKLVLIVALLLLPVIMWYLSPAIIITGASKGIITGSFIVFMLMLFGSIFFGRLFCGYICPAGGLQECIMMVNDKSLKQGFRNSIKYVIWGVWFSVVVVCFVLSKSKITVNPFYMTDHGISITGIFNYVIYYGVIGFIFIPALIHGKRAFCHYFCWMAPFMVIGEKIGKVLHIPHIYIKSDKSKCISCKQCNKNCQMSLDVAGMVADEKFSNSECIQCGACIDSCPKKALNYRFGIEENYCGKR